MPGFNFAQYVLPEETKRSSPMEKLTLEQFSRKVHSKHNLLYALGVKGKFPAKKLRDLHLIPVQAKYSFQSVATALWSSSALS